eukprot:309285_1
MGNKKLHHAMRFTAGILWVIATIFIIILFTSFLTKKKHHQSMAKSPFIFSIFIFVFVIIAGINFSYVHLATGLDISLPFIPIFSNIAVVCLIMEFCLIQCSFINRLSIVFAGSVFDYSRCFYITMYVVAIITVLSVVIGRVIGLLFKFWMILLIQGFGLFVYMFNCMFLTYLFIHSLNKVVNSTSDKSLRMNPNDPTSPIQIMIKFIVLLLLCMTSSTLFSAALLAQDLGTHISLNGLVWILQPIDSSMNIISIYFQFTSFQDQYFTIFGRFHAWIGVTFFNQLNKDEINLTNIVAVQSTSDLEMSSAGGTADTSNNQMAP